MDNFKISVSESNKEFVCFHFPVGPGGPPQTLMFHYSNLMPLIIELQALLEKFPQEKKMTFDKDTDLEVKTVYKDVWIKPSQRDNKIGVNYTVSDLVELHKIGVLTKEQVIDLFVRSFQLKSTEAKALRVELTTDKPSRFPD
jgi:hypothetical protein